MIPFHSAGRLIRRLLTIALLGHGASGARQVRVSQNDGGQSSVATPPSLRERQGQRAIQGRPTNGSIGP